mmetsp:Transcript_15229/g.39201  ORF Transcript_15229/g.39201 Transcript_15229/m.39201 type:complete len:238 (-) Transcript_15229:728-1441(-)
MKALNSSEMLSMLMPCRVIWCSRFCAALSICSHASSACARRLSRKLAKRDSHADIQRSRWAFLMRSSPTAMSAYTAPATSRQRRCSSLSCSSSPPQPVLNDWLYAASAASAPRRHSASATPCQAVEMHGTAPLLMASTYAFVIPASMGPVSVMLPMRLGCPRWKMALVSAASCARNSGRSSDESAVSSRCSSFSSLTGRTRVKHSRSGKRCLMEARIWFLASTEGPLPPTGRSAVSR